MNEDCIILILLLFMHFFSDFVCQSREQAERKSSSILALLVHCYEYTCWIGVTTIAISGIFKEIGVDVFGILWYTISLGYTHLCIDFCTSKFNKWAYKNKHDKLFWTGIGFDQWLHQICIIIFAHDFLDILK